MKAEFLVDSFPTLIGGEDLQINKYKVLMQDTREKPHAVVGINKYFETQGYHICRTKALVGDYQLLHNPFFTVDRKQNIQELIGNVCQDHARFKRECILAQKLSIKLVVLVANKDNIKCIDDLKLWINPRIKKSPRATKGTTLAKTLHTMQNLYGVEFLFCNEIEVGQKIIDLLVENDK